MNDVQQLVTDRRFELELAEATGRETPPDRTDAVLALFAEPPRAKLAHRVAAAVAFVAIVPVAWLVATRARVGEVAVEPAPALLAEDVEIPVVEPPPPAPMEPSGAAVTSAKPSAVHAAGADPADLAARRSAERMLEVEGGFAERVRSGSLPSSVRPDLTVLPFPVLTGWSYTRGLDGVPESVRELDGDEVAMLGFMLPIDEVRGMRRFLLVHSMWSCCYGTPPDVNGLVMVEMPAGATVDHTMDPVAVIGTFRVRERTEDGYVVDVFQLEAQTVVVVD